uniref:LNR domain-containing protein n=1 Tax=Paramoeba aestuarina TaxID=180227 RepID=A0A7S4PC76_9EUKA|mmetsp:Transcript_39905/g.63066  ORF Transcript_39905/g.63066 Transcript_39905/m.63066 type:complete len:160 (+) Transcript_39905:50-529(+)
MLRFESVCLLLCVALLVVTNAQPSSWTCSDSYYNTRDGCDCDCGAEDPDCYDPTESLFGCSSTGVCVEGVCSSSHSIPSSWSCPDSFYASRDGCDCECGAWDPDCDDPAQSLGLLYCDEIRYDKYCTSTSHQCGDRMKYTRFDRRTLEMEMCDALTPFH